MALGSNHITTSHADVMIPEIWGERVNNFYRRKLKGANFFEDWSEDVAEGGDTINVPNVSEMSANSKSVGDQVTLERNTETDTTLEINKHQHVAFVIEDAVGSKIKGSYKAQELYAKNAGYTVASTLEDEIFDLFKSFTNSVGDSSNEIGDSEIREALGYMDSNDVDMDEVAFFLHPNVIWNQLMGIDKFTLVQNTAGADPVMQGQVGLLYGKPLISSSRLPTDDGARVGALAHPGAIAYATANATPGATEDTVRLQSQYLLDYLGTLVVADIIFGVKMNRDTDGGVLIKAKS